jgi:4-amino-4-deoxy-L-arabinose transferase-like glycosyltransferase
MSSRRQSVPGAAMPLASFFRPSVLVALVALATGLFMVFIGFHAQSLVDTTFDSYDYGGMGLSFARGDGFAPFGMLIGRRAPLYPLVIGAIYFFVGEQPTLILLLHCVLLVATCLLVLDMGRKLFSERAGVIAALLCALNPMLLRYVGDLQVEIPLTFLLTLTVWASISLYQRPSLWSAIVVGVSAGLACLTKAVVLPYPLLLAAAIIGLALLRRRAGANIRVPWVQVSVMIAAMFLVIAPWTARNYVATGGHFILISSGASDAFLRGYVFTKPEYATLRLPPYEYAENESNALLRSITGETGSEDRSQVNDYAVEQELNQAAVERLKANPADFVRKFATGLVTFWYEMTSLTNSLVAGVLALGAWLFAIVALRRSVREKRPAWLLVLPIVTLNLFLAVLLALGRYSVPILPPLLVLSGFGIDTLLSRRARSTV